MAASRAVDQAASDSPARRSGKPRQYVVKEGYLPVSEFLFNRPGAGSPYGEDNEFPLPVDQLPYRHPEQPTPRER